MPRIIRLASAALLVALAVLLPWWLSLLMLLGLAARAVVFVSRAKPPWDALPLKGDGHALVVLDMQQALCGDERQYPDGYALIGRVNGHIATAKQLGDPVLYIRQQFAPWDPLCYLAFGGRLMRGWAGTELVVGLDASGGPQFVKSRQDAFSSPDFCAYLAENGIRALSVAGIDTAAYVLRTAQSGQQRGYDVTILADAVSSRNEQAGARALRTALHEDIAVK